MRATLFHESHNDLVIIVAARDDALQTETVQARQGFQEDTDGARVTIRTSIPPSHPACTTRCCRWLQSRRRQRWPRPTTPQHRQLVPHRAHRSRVDLYDDDRRPHTPTSSFSPDRYCFEYFFLSPNSTRLFSSRARSPSI